MVVMKKLAGYGSKNEMKRPAQVTARAVTTEMAITLLGRVARCCAVAAGVTIREKMRRTPVTCTATETATPTSSRKVTPRRRVGSPFASATSSSNEEKSSGL